MNRGKNKAVKRMHERASRAFEPDLTLYWKGVTGLLPDGWWPDGVGFKTLRALLCRAKIDNGRMVYVKASQVGALRSACAKAAAGPEGFALELVE